MTNLYLVQLPIRLRPFTHWALDRRYFQVPPGDGSGRPRTAVAGYALHAALTGLFGEQAPRPFFYSPLGQRERHHTLQSPTQNAGEMDLLGYARSPIDTLKTLAQLGSSGLTELINWEYARSKLMPTHWPKHLCLRFDLRACPVRRLMRPLVTRGDSSRRPETIGRGKEVDAYQHAAVLARDRDERMPTRDEVYLAWLKQRLVANPNQPEVIRLISGSVRVKSYRSVRLFRRPRYAKGKRSAQWLTRPDVQFTGLLEIAEPDLFPDLLTSGIGRHCGFGFGMLLLRPA